MVDYNPDYLDDVPGDVVYAKKNRAGRELVYPPQGFSLTNPPEVFQVNAGEVATYQVDLGASVSEVQQPVCVKNISDVFKIPAFSCYIVTDGEHKRVDPTIWRNAGGRIHVHVNRDTTTATIELFGPGLPGRSPFLIGFDDGANTWGGPYILGTGIATWKRSIELETGLSTDLVQDDTVAELDNPYLQTLEQAWDAGHAALGRRLGDFQKVTFNTTGVDLGDPQVDPQRPETALGKVAGARVIFDGSYYRVRTATVTESGVSQITAEQDTTVGDFQDAMPSGLTFDQLNALWAGARAVRDFNGDPLNGGDLA